MFSRRRLLSFPMLAIAVGIGVVSGRTIFGPSVDEYWRKKISEEAAAKKSETPSA